MTDPAPPLQAVSFAIDATGDQNFADQLVAEMAPRVAEQLGLVRWASQRDVRCEASVAFLTQPNAVAEVDLIDAIEDAVSGLAPDASDRFRRLVAFQGDKKPRWLRRVAGVRRGYDRFDLDTVASADWWRLETGSSRLASRSLARERTEEMSRKTLAIAHAIVLCSPTPALAAGRAAAVGDEIGRSLGETYGRMVAFLKSRAQQTDLSSLVAEIGAEVEVVRHIATWRDAVVEPADSGLALSTISWARHANRLSFNLLEAVYLCYVAERAAGLLANPG